MSVIGVARSRIRQWKADPVQQVRDLFKVEPDPWQKDLLTAFASPDPDKRRISLQACAGPGKSAGLSWCGWNFLTCYGARGDHPKGAATAINGDNLRDNLWAELGKWYDRSDFLKRAFEFTTQRIFARDHAKTWFISARTFSKKANPDEQGRTLSGLHSGYVLALIDESAEIPVAVAKTAEQALGNCKWGKIVQAGNPTGMDGMLYAAAEELAHLWYLIRITGNPADPKRSTRIPAGWAQEQIDTYGMDDPWVMAYILGKFPPSAITSLLGPDDVEDAMERHLAEDAYGFSQKRLGVDVARFGDDETVIFPRQGLAAFKPVVIHHQRTHEIAARALQAKEDWGAETIYVDDTGGFGAGVIDALLQAGESPIPVQYAGKATKDRYFNKRSEILFEMTQWVKRGGALPRDAQLKRELVKLTYTLFKGKLRVVEKDVLKKLLGRSPDRSDALAQTFAIVDMPAGTQLDLGNRFMTPQERRAQRSRRTGEVERSYNPYSDERMKGR